MYYVIRVQKINLDFSRNDAYEYFLKDPVGQSTLDSSAMMDSIKSSILNVSTRSISGKIEQLEANIFALEAKTRRLKLKKRY